MYTELMYPHPYDLFRRLNRVLSMPSMGEVTLTVKLRATVDLIPVTYSPVTTTLPRGLICTIVFPLIRPRPL